MIEVAVTAVKIYMRKTNQAFHAARKVLCSSVLVIVKTPHFEAQNFISIQESCFL